MKDGAKTVFWQWTDTTGIERMTLRDAGDLVFANSTVIGTDEGGYRLDHRWRLTKDWRVLAVEVEKWGVREHERLQLDRVDNGWAVNSVSQPDLGPMSRICRSPPSATLSNPAADAREHRKHYIKDLLN